MNVVSTRDARHQFYDEIIIPPQLQIAKRLAGRDAIDIRFDTRE